jgi:hypothetical protein
VTEWFCADAVSLTDKGSGRYLATYVPSAAGFDFLELYNSLYDIRVQDAELVDSDATFFDIGSASVDLTQDYNGVGRLKVVASTPANFVLYVFRSQDWQSGRTDPEYALKATAIDAFGNWVSSPLTVLKDTYHIVAVSTDGSLNVISPFLQVQ